MSFKRLIAKSQIDNSCEALNSVVGNSKVVKFKSIVNSSHYLNINITRSIALHSF